MLENVEHRDGRKLTWLEGCPGEGATEGGDAVLLPGDLGGVQGVIETDDSVAAFAEEAEEESAAATDVEHGAAGGGGFDG